MVLRGAGCLREDWDDLCINEYWNEMQPAYDKAISALKVPGEHVQSRPMGSPSRPSGLAKMMATALALGTP